MTYKTSRPGGFIMTKPLTSDTVRSMDALENWFRLDNAAKLYPAIENRHRPSVFRVSVDLTERVDPGVLEKAVNRVLPRFPSFQVNLVRGLFWYYFEKNRRYFIIEEDGPPYCRRIVKAETDKYLFRVRWSDFGIALEVFHAITDGTGAMVFLKTLAAQYLELRYPDLRIPPQHDIRDREELPRLEELEDSFSRFYSVKPRRPKAESSAFHLRGISLDPGRIRVIIGESPVKELREYCRERNVTITEFLTSVFIYALYQVQKQHGGRKRAIRISVPVNLRKMYKSDTLRNFTLFIKPGIDPYLGEYTFDEILHQVHHFMRYELNEKYLREVFSSNVYMEKKMLIRVMPLAVKNRFITYVFKHSGENYYSGTLSNLGQVSVPPEMENYISGFHFVLGPNRINRSNCTLISFKDKILISFARNIEETDMEREFYQFLVSLGIPVSVSVRG